MCTTINRALIHRLFLVAAFVIFPLMISGCAEQVRILEFNPMSAAGVSAAPYKVNIQNVSFAYKPEFEEKLIGGEEQFKKRFIEHLTAQKLLPVVDEQGDGILTGSIEIKEDVSINGWLAPAIPLALTVVLLPVALALPRITDTYEVTANMKLVCCRTGNQLWSKEIKQTKKMHLNNYNMLYDKADSKPNKGLAELIDNVLKQTAVEMAGAVNNK